MKALLETKHCHLHTAGTSYVSLWKPPLLQPAHLIMPSVSGTLTEAVTLDNSIPNNMVIRSG